MSIDSTILLFSEWKSGNKVGETFEESMKSHQIPFEYLTFGRELGQVSKG
jgi:hypothetical protein